MHYRSGPALGYTYEEARAAGLNSASRGRDAYLKHCAAYACLIKGITPTLINFEDVRPMADRYNGTLTLRTFSNIKGAANTAIAKAKDFRGRTYQDIGADAVRKLADRVQYIVQTSSKRPMKKEKR